MDMTGEQRIEASRERVWQALNDPEILKQCIPGCEELQKLSDTRYEAKVVAKVGPVKAKFSGKVTLSDLDPPNGYTITGEGSGGAAGFGKGGAKVSLAEDGPEATVLSYTAHATVGGKLAQIGSRLVDATARKMADDFFARFTTVVGSPGTGGEATPVEVVGAAPDTEAAASGTPAPQALATETPALEKPASEAPEPRPAGAVPARPAGRGLSPTVWIAGVVVLVEIGRAHV